MSNDIQRSQRLGFKVPRSILLPPYLAMNPYFVEYADAIDEVYADTVDSKIRVIENIRNMWVTNVPMEEKVLTSDMLDFSDWSQPEREILVEQVNNLGMRLKSAGVLSNDAYHRISRFLGQYWFEKGTYSFIEFINFCIGSDLRVYRMWSHNGIPGQYYNMKREVDGEPPGTPIWEGGEWFPTTHVEIESVGGLPNIDVATLTEFFYEIANYNLVLSAIDTSLSLPIVDVLEEGKAEANIVALGVFVDAVGTLSTEGRYGAPSPPKVQLSTDLPTKVLTLGPPNDNFPLLVEPSGWFLDRQNRRIPIYSPEHRVVEETSDLPTAVTGGPSTTMVDDDANGYVTMAGPLQWVKVPGSSRSKGRIPVWTAEPSTVTALQSIEARTVGIRKSLLVNPLGWFEIQPGLYAPYW